ncbi:MAG: hypothetical protein WD342_19650 [Verrucomicrobiales bacterium]
MAIIQDWKIRSTNARCELTEREFEDGEEFFTCIFDDPESDGFIRRDYSVESWSRVKSEIEPQPFSFWKSTYKKPVEVEDKKAIEDTSVEGMLRRFVEEDDPRTENARYILALMLERKKTLVPVDSKETETRRLLFYEHAGSGDVFIVADPDLKLAEIEVVQREVSELLAAEEAAARSSDEETLEEDAEANEDQSENGGDEAAQAEN